MYILITDENVYTARSLKKLRKKTKLGLDDVSFERIGTVNVASLRKQEVYEILADKLLIENTALNRLYKSDIGLTELIILLNTLFLIILMFRK